METIKRSRKPFKNSNELKALDYQNNLKRIKKFNDTDKTFNILTKINDGKNKKLKEFIK